MLRPFDLNLRHLRALSDVVAQGSLNAAADAVGLSQPALTQGLRKLERQLGAVLFERRSDGMSATPAGLAMADRSARAFACLAAAGPGAARSGRGFARPDRLMTATQLDAFLRLADAGSFAGAAAASGLSQPAIHRAVRDLEQVCAAPLAERRGRGIALTAAGRRLARGVRLAAVEIAAGISETQGESESGGVRISIGAMPLSRARVLPRAIARFVAAWPGVTIDVVEGSWRELVEPLRDGVIDLMIGALRDPSPPGLEQRALFTDRLVVVARAGHPLAGRRVGAEALARFPWIVGSADTPIRARWDALFAGADPPEAPVECGSVMVIRGVLAESDLLTLLSHDQIALEVTSGVLTVIDAPTPGAAREIGVTARADWRPTAQQAALLRVIEDAAIQNKIQES